MGNVKYLHFISQIFPSLCEIFQESIEELFVLQRQGKNQIYFAKRH